MGEIKSSSFSKSRVYGRGNAHENLNLDGFHNKLRKKFAKIHRNQGICMFIIQTEKIQGIYVKPLKIFYTRN